MTERQKIAMLKRGDDEARRRQGKIFKLGCLKLRLFLRMFSRTSHFILRRHSPAVYGQLSGGRIATGALTNATGSSGSCSCLYRNKFRRRRPLRDRGQTKLRLAPSRINHQPPLARDGTVVCYLSFSMRPAIRPNKRSSTVKIVYMSRTKSCCVNPPYCFNLAAQSAHKSDE